MEKHIKNGKAAWLPLGYGRAVLILFKAIISPAFLCPRSQGTPPHFPVQYIIFGFTIQYNSNFSSLT